MVTIAQARAAVRDSLQAAGLPAGVSAAPPRTPQPPAVLLVPGDPYFDPDSIGDGVGGEVQLLMMTVVSRPDAETELAELERLTVQAMQALPQGWTVGQVSRPARIPLDDDGQRFGLSTQTPITTRIDPNA